MEKETVKLETHEYYWYCPKCSSYNFVKADDAFEDCELKDVTCDDCKTEFMASLED